MTRDYIPEDNATSKKFADALQNSQVGKLYTCHWHCYYVLDKQRPLVISIYKANEASKKIILKYSNNIYFTNYENSIDQTTGFVADDICFFHKDKLLLGTVSHAEICHIYPPSDEVLELFLENASWQEIDYLPEEFIELNKCF